MATLAILPLWRGRLFAHVRSTDRLSSNITAGFALAAGDTPLMTNFINRLCNQLGWAMTELQVWLAEVQHQVTDNAETKAQVMRKCNAVFDVSTLLLRVRLYWIDHLARRG